MLVEDDNNLREIYEARLLAEGYEIVSAEDGEQALALAVKEKPDLIISDVMMPKISGFDMLDILRSTPETRNTKVIMMTALSQAEDKARADKLGADRYLVKSQVTLEDVAKVAREVLQDEDTVPAASAAMAAPQADIPAQSPTPTPVPSTIVPVPIPEPPAPTQVPVAPVPEPTTGIPPVSTPAEPPSAAPATPPAPSPDPAQTVTSSDPGGSSPIEPPKVSPEPTISLPAVDAAQTQTAASETANIEKQITDFVQNMPSAAPTVPTASAPPVSAPTQSTPVAPEPASPPAADATNAAAGSAANMAGTVNNLLRSSDRSSDQKSDQPNQQSGQQPAAPQPAAPLASNQIAGKKIIKPINDLSAKSGPDLNELLAREMQNAGGALPNQAPAPLPQATPQAPATPVTEEEVDIKPPGNVVQPGGADDPNNIAL